MFVHFCCFVFVAQTDWCGSTFDLYYNISVAIIFCVVHHQHMTCNGVRQTENRFGFGLKTVHNICVVPSISLHTSFSL